MKQRRSVIDLIQDFSIPLIVGVFAGLAAANIDHHLYEKLVDHRIFGDGAVLFGRHITVHFLINEIFMVFFFGIAAKEVTESVIPGGALNPIRRAINPIMGTLGGVVGPVGLFFLLVWAVYGRSQDFAVVANGWGIPTATDIALAWLVARLVFGARHPAVSFLLLLAVADDAIGLGIIAVFYPNPELPVQPAWLLVTAAGMVAALALRRRNVVSWPMYILFGGVLSWIGLSKAAIEPALALVVIVPFLPGPHQGTGTTAAEDFEDARHFEPRPIESPGHGDSPLERFEATLKLPVTLGLFFFAFANAGVAFGAINELTYIILISLIVGKTVGISLFCLAARQVGFPLPAGMGVKHLVVAGVIGGLGLTVALFVAGKAYAGPPFQDPAKMGAVFSAGAALIAILLGAALRVKDEPGDPPP